MEFESKYIEKMLDKDYFGFEPAFINGEGYRQKREEVGEEEIIKFTEEPQDNDKIMIIKGVEEMKNYNSLELNDLLEEFAGEEFEFEKFEKELPKEAIEALKKAYKTLLKYKNEMNEDLKRAMTVITRYIGIKYPDSEPYPEKKELEKREPVDWLTVRNQLFGELVESEPVEVEKSDISESDPFPSLSKQFEKNEEIIDETIEENNLEERLL